MFWILYTLNVAALLIGIYTRHYEFIGVSFFTYILISMWNSDRNELKTLQLKLNDADNHDEIMATAKQKAKEFKELNWFQKIIYLTAFKAGADYILRKLK